ncbi:serine hydrolase domain-containing protein [Methyloceanibacter sp.]|uniref:serine hydrolase domain-containing protein n=1 Tax=Methyloceanibacter sp. TaxID=1965321 RepID=UPI003D6D170C
MPARLASFPKPWLRLLAAVVGVAAAATLAVAASYLSQMAEPYLRTAKVGSTVLAKTLCSGVFVSHRVPEAVRAEDLSGPDYKPLEHFKWNVDLAGKRAKASYCLLGTRVTISCFIETQTAIFRDGLGCTVVDTTEDALRSQSAGLPPPAPASNPEALWPDGEGVDLEAIPAGVDRAALEAAMKAACAEPDEKRPRGTRALVVVYDGRIVAECYGAGFDAKMPLLGWSMAKTATNTLVGLRVQDGKLAIAKRALLDEPEWRAGGVKSGIALDELLRMTSGLVFNEDYDAEDSDVRQMLLSESDKSGYAAARRLKHTPGTYWDYSSGTTNIIARVLRQSFADEQDYLRYPRERLFVPIGMSSAVFEPDAAGIFVGSSYLYASARDWARLGLLYLRDGMWQGKRLLPEGWVKYSLTPAPHAPDARYGAQVWLKLDSGATGDSPDLGEPPFPEDSYYMLGHDGQIVSIVPSRDLVIVRLGLTPGSAWDPARVLAPIVQAFPPRS